MQKGKIQEICRSRYVILFIVLVISCLAGVGIKLINVVVCATMPILWFYFVYKVLLETGEINRIKSWSKNDKIVVLCMYIVSNVLLLSILLKERYVRFWDFAGYWGVSIEVSNQFFDAPLKTLQELYQSINQDEYNRLIPCVIAFPLKILGNSFAMYALIIYNMFVSTTYIAICGCVENLLEKKKQYGNIKITCIILLLTPAFYLPVLLGYLDAFALCNLGLAYLIISTNYFGTYDVKKSILLAISLLLCVLGRRYFAFAVVGVAFGVIISCIVQIVREQQISMVKNIAKNGLVIVLVMGGILFVFFKPFLINSFDGTIAEAYSAYQTGGFARNYWLLIKYFGVAIILSTIIGCISLVKKSINDFIVYCISSFVTTYMFYRIQSMGNHHYYLVIIPIMVFGCVGVISLKKNKMICGICLSMVVGNFVLANVDMRLPVNIEWIASDQKMLPKVREDIPVLEEITNKLNKYSKEGKSSYVLASSTTINDDLLRKIYMPDKLLSIGNMYVSSHVDLRDGFQKDFLKADIVVVANPIQYHLREDSQRVIGLLAEEFIEQKGIYHNYQHLEDYVLDDNVTVSLYERISDYSEEDLIYLQDLFDKYYKEYPKLFRDRISLE